VHDARHELPHRRDDARLGEIDHAIVGDAELVYASGMRWLIAGVSLFVASCWSSYPDGCDAACDSTMTMIAKLAMPESALSGATITFCQNSACASATLAPLAPGDLSQNGSTGAFYMIIDVADNDGDGATTDPTMSWITAQLEQTDDNGVTFTNGDTYTLTVAAPGGDVLYTNTVSVGAYESESVCGLTCQEMTVSI
jgi:hypothetical protein